MSIQEYSLSQSATRARNILRNVFVWMTLGLALTAVVAFGVAGSPSLMRTLFSSQWVFFGLIIAQVAMVWFLSSKVMTLKPTAAIIAFAAYAALNGLTMALIFTVYGLGAVFKAFTVTALMFGGMALFGAVTKRDLSKIGSILGMAVWGIIIASLVNMFLRSSTMDYIISFVGVVVFTGLTAYDTQKIKAMSDQYSESVGEPDYIRMSILGALILYLDFINLFLMLLRLFSGRSRD